MEINKVQLHGVVRGLLYMVGTWFVRKGYIHDQSIPFIIGALMDITAMVHMWIVNRKSHLAKKALEVYSEKKGDEILIKPNGGKLPAVTLFRKGESGK